MLKAALRITLTSLCIIVSGCSPQWREPQPTDDLKAAMQVWMENQELCQSVIAQGNPCPQPNPPISFVYNAEVGSRREGFYAGLESVGAVASQIVPLALPALGIAVLAE